MLNNQIGQAATLGLDCDDGLTGAVLGEQFLEVVATVWECRGGTLGMITAVMVASCDG
jgi:hypothetical protein